MSTNRGIFENFPNQAANPKDSPFAIVNEPGDAASAASPFAATASQKSPFAVVDESKEAPKAESPFQVAEPSEGFGFEAPEKKGDSATAEAAPDPTPAATKEGAASPFAAPESAPGASASTQAALAAFGTFQDVTPAKSAPFSSASAAPAPVSTVEESLSDSFSIRQLELRAIFGVDREMTVEEILQRSRALPGIRNIARVSEQDMGAIEGLKNLISNLGFGGGGLKLYSGSVPLEFIREGKVLLAVQTDGGFAPGVRETLMLVARELGRM